MSRTVHETGLPLKQPFIICTAANDAYLPFLLGLLRSLRAHSYACPFDIGVLDVGLSDQARDQLQPFNVKVAQPVTGFDYPGRAVWEDKNPAFRAMTGRPFLRDSFPGYDVYVWMDADSWVQTPEAINTLFAEAQRDPALCIASEIDRCYTPYFTSSKPWEFHLNWYRANFDAADVAAIFPRPMLNSGVFALRADAPVWAAWAALFAQCLCRVEQVTSAQFMADQLCLNMAVYKNGLPLKVMPATYNWLTLYALPMVDSANGLLVEPTAPYRPISIVHATHKPKTDACALATTAGEIVQRNLQSPF